ncbi:MAG: purine-binding chemotaxis protein CheW [Elusimicrobia bacterium]|nr:purine-binding chemotaxis protein CheW [Elusimicrobiota bacterium]
MSDKTMPLLTEEAQTVQLIVFHVGDEEFGVPIGAIQEIVRTGQITPIPDSPDFVQGLINVRGEIVAIINLTARFFLSASKEGPRHIVITQQEENLFGLLVDEVTEVLRIPKSEIKLPPKLITTIHEEYVDGVVTVGNRLIILLDLARVLSTEELERLSDMARKHGEQGMEEPEKPNLETEARQPVNVEGISVKDSPQKLRRRKNK